MALITIRVNQFKDAESDCSKVRDEANDYSDAIQDKILKKIYDYDGDWTSNMTTARDNLREKRDDLDDKASAFITLKNDVSDLRTNIISAEQALTQKIEDLVGDYCNKYGLDSEKSWWQKIWEAITLDCVEDFLKFCKDLVQAGLRTLKNWYRFDGGRERMNLAIKWVAYAGAVIGLAIAALATGGIVFVIAGVIVAAIAIADATVQLLYSMQSYSSALQDDPVWARRYESKANNETFTSLLRQNGLYLVADIVDITELVCNIINIAQLGSNLKKGFTKFGFKGFIKQGIANIKNNTKLLFTNKDAAKFFFAGDVKKTLGTIKDGLGLSKIFMEFGYDFFNGEGLSAFGDFTWEIAKEATTFFADLSGSDLAGDLAKSQYENALTMKDNAQANKLLTDYKNSESYLTAKNNTPTKQSTAGKRTDKPAKPTIANEFDIGNTEGSFKDGIKIFEKTKKSLWDNGSSNLESIGNAGKYIIDNPIVISPVLPILGPLTPLKPALSY